MLDSNIDKGIEREAHENLLDVISTGLQRGTLPGQTSLRKANASLASHLPESGFGLQDTTRHLLDDIGPGLNASSLSANYYGFVTGGVTPAARIADNIVSVYDQNVQVHLPEQTVATSVEDAALLMLQEMLEFEPAVWMGRTFTTGATASNVLGLACGREAALQLSDSGENSLDQDGRMVQHDSIAKVGLLEVCRRRGIDTFQVLSTMPHSSLSKAASLVGLGRANVKNIAEKQNPLKIDLKLLVDEAQKPRTANILVISCGEVNTGRFATEGMEELQQIRAICDKHNIWIHVDGAFGIFGRALQPGPEFDEIKRGSDGLELADSLTGDCHKLLNVVSRPEADVSSGSD